MSRRSAAPTVATFVTDAPLGEASPDAPWEATLGEDAAHHMRVRRLAVGERVALRDGLGRSADGTLVRLAKSAAVVACDVVREHPRPPAVHLLVPVADRDRMLWAAEKCVEIGAASWRAVRFHRSASVGGRGEGAAFQDKLRARMRAALGQSEAAWLPTLRPDAPLDVAAREAAPGLRLALDAEGAPALSLAPVATDAVTLVVGPEGGMEPDELAALDVAGFRRTALPGNVLRFETAVALGAAFGRALLERAAGEPPR